MHETASLTRISVCVTFKPSPPRSPGPSSQAPAFVPSKPFKPCGGIHERLSVRSVNPYAYAARPAPDNDMSLLQAR